MSALPEPARPRPLLSSASTRFTHEARVVDEFGHERVVQMPAERDLTLYLDKRELVTLMTMGGQPELLALGYLRNQRLVTDIAQIESVQVDWDVNACAITTRGGVADIEARTARRIVTTGCGQGTVFGGLMDEVGSLRLGDTRLTQGELYGLLDAMRRHETVYKSAGSVHGCALFEGERLLLFTEDVGRHNALDAIAGWMWLEGVSGEGKTLYTTGRLTSEMVIKSAQMGVAVVVSRSGITEMGHRLAEQLGMALFARCTNRHFLLYTGRERFVAQPELAPPAPPAA
ncbi:formate dehydrogenase accessory sulfurtransferase FdhD [Caldimonas thermodepolymerans]|uniref:formate dehydrogenase accessory sulfurtransferase FdhD n=1 Tax=Caldimonas thermodepolymerans TaxID=215580 RepID=UPI002235CEF9|nr:formate dehydrogenase accessory sulfurtransferase FdhD [Caldimonas thermodepolymerans]UZG43425.1 formate dehydrogenase accessory sulfurtransferase FdhD [Caldimonas thermodepolymerans]